MITLTLAGLLATLIRSGILHPPTPEAPGYARRVCADRLADYSWRQHHRDMLATAADIAQAVDEAAILRAHRPLHRHPLAPTPGRAWDVLAQQWATEFEAVA